MHKKTTLFAAVLLFFSHALFATHIVGGEMRYECLGFNSQTMQGQYFITLKVYRDCYNGVPWFDNPASIGVYSAVQGQLVTELQVSPLSNDTIPVTINQPCVLDPNGICVNVARYQTTVTLPYLPEGYIFVYQRCCRNEIINNIPSPAETGATYQLFMSGEAQLAANICPFWNAYPPVTVCLGKPLSHDHSAYDENGDSLVYSFCAPLKGGTVLAPQPVPPLGPPYEPIAFDTSYSATNPMGGNPIISIDPATGLITGTPDRLGNFVIGVCCREYRNGVLFSEFTRDFQYIVSSCNQSRLLLQLDNSVPCDTTLDQIELVLPTNNPGWWYYCQWSNGVNGTNIISNLTPGEAYTVTVTGVASLGGTCTSVITINGNDCVWPGDANYDGVANNEDILAIGLFYGDNGPVRYNATTDWTAQHAAYWNDVQVSGANTKHVDCDGSGSINIFDTIAVVKNYSLLHPTAYGGELVADAPLLSLELDSPDFSPGAIVQGKINLGDAVMRAKDAYGIAFSILCDHPEVLDTAFLSVGNYGNSVFGDRSHIITIYKPFLQEGRFDFAVCNVTRKAFATLYGEVASFTFGLAADNPGATVHFSFDNVRLIDAKGNSLPVNIQNDFITTSLFEVNNPVKAIRILPNPAQNTVRIYFDQSPGDDVQIDILDMSGRIVRSVAADNSAGQHEIPLDITGLPKGMYIMQALDGHSVFGGRFVVE